ncbi:MFS transporter [Streptomyces sp. NPDC002643]
MTHAKPLSSVATTAFAPGRSPRANAVVAVLAFGGIVVALMQTLVIPIVPELPTLLAAPASDTAWAVTATLLAAVVATPVTGRLGDMYGKRRMLLVSLVLLVAGSVTCALSDSLTPLLVGRVLQGLASGVVPLGLSILRDELPADRLGSATALMSSSLGIGGALGLPAAALIADTFDWHALFWASSALGVVALALVPLLVPESRVRTGGRFDLLGALGMAVGLVCLLLAISKGADWGWTGGTTLGLFAGALVTLPAWGWWELRTDRPLVDLRTTARRQVLVTNLASIAVGFSMFAMSLVLPQLLQLPEATGYGLGQSLLAAGLVVAPSGLVMMSTAPVSAALTKARGPKATLMVGALIVAAGYGLNLLLMSEVWHFVLVACVIGAGIGFTYGAMPALIMGAVPASETAAANSLNTLMRSIGTSTAGAVAGVILAHMTTGSGTTALPSENAFKTVLAIGAGAALLALTVASFIPGQGRAGTEGVQRAEGTEGTEEGPGETEVEEVAGFGAGGSAEATARGAGTDTSRGTDTDTGAGTGRGTGTGTGLGVPILGRVRGVENVAVPAAALTLVSLDGRQLGRTVAGTDGSYAVYAPGAGSYVLIAAAEGHQPKASTVVVPDCDAGLRRSASAAGAPVVSYDVLLSGTSGLAGVVRSAESGAPVAGAAVIVTDELGEVLAGERTDELGEFTIADLVPGTVTLAVSSPEHRPLARVVEVGATALTRVELELWTGARVRGTVRAGGVPLGDARVTLVDAAGNVVATTTTGADGAYAFSDLDGGQYTVIASGYPPRATALTLKGDAGDDHDIELAHTEGL